MDDHRLEAIEKKLDRLTEAVSKLAIVDERLTNLIAEGSRNSIRIKSVEDDITTLTVEVEKMKTKLSAQEKLGWIMISGLVPILWSLIF